jgi:hypothetical protein
MQYGIGFMLACYALFYFPMKSSQSIKSSSVNQLEDWLCNKSSSFICGGKLLAKDKDIGT